MKFDRDAAVNPGRFLSTILVEELRRQGLGYVVICPGARNQPLLGALSVRDDIERHIVVDERAAGHLALGWLRGRAAAGKAPALAAVITTSGSAPLLVAPALAEAQAMSLPLMLLSADRPAELQGVGANQTLDQTSPLRSLVNGQFNAACHAGGIKPRNLLGVAAEAAAVAMGPPAGPVHLNLAYRDPLAPEPAPLPDGWRESMAGWAEQSATANGPAVESRPSSVAVDQLREELASAQRPIIWAAGLSNDADRRVALGLASSSGAPWLADIGSGLRLTADQPRRLDHAEFYPDRLADADFVLQFGRRPVSLRLGRALSGARRWLVDDHPERQDPWRQGGKRLTIATAALADAQLKANPEAEWRDQLLATDTAWEQHLTRHVDQADDLSESWIARELTRRLDADHGLLLGNSLAVRHLDTMAAPVGPSPFTLTSRGTSGIEGLIAQAVGATQGLGRPTVALLGDLTVSHDLGSLPLLGQSSAPLLVLVIQNQGGAIFRQLPGGRHPHLLEPWLLADQGLDLAAVADAMGLKTHRVADRDGFISALSSFLAEPGPMVIEAVVEPDGHVRLLDQVQMEGPA